MLLPAAWFPASAVPVAVTPAEHAAAAAALAAHWTPPQGLDATQFLLQVVLLLVLGV
jgi:hypothetical protein